MRIDAGEVSSIVAAAVALLGFPVLWLQLKEAKRQRLAAIKLSGAQVLLALDSVLAAYNEIGINLGAGGKWHGSEDHPNKEEMPRAGPYLGVFERAWIAYTVGQIDIATIEHLYRHRIQSIWANLKIVKVRLQDKDRREGWSSLLLLPTHWRHSAVRRGGSTSKARDVSRDTRMIISHQNGSKISRGSNL